MASIVVITRQRKIGMKELQPHEQRVVDEQTELQDKVSKLEAFIVSSPIYQKLDATQQGLLSAQLGAMKAYLEILQLRVASF